MDNRTIGENIRKWRDFRAKKQEDLAEEISVCRITLSRYENGMRDIPVSHLLACANTLKITVEDLLKEN